MKVINSNRNDFDNIVKNNELQCAIKDSNGRVIISEVVVNKPFKYGGINDVDLLKSHGSDMITLKKYNYKDNTLQLYKQMNSNTLIGLNFEIKNGDDECDTFNDSNIKVLNDTVDYVVLTIYEHTVIDVKQLESKLEKIRKSYKGFVLLNRYVSDVDNFLDDSLKIIELLKSYQINALAMPMIYTKPGIEKSEVKQVIKLLRQSDILSCGTICTSQEDSNKEVMISIALKAKELGFDMHMIGDAASCMITDESNLYNYSVAIRGKRHTYFRMVN